MDKNEIKELLKSYNLEKEYGTSDKDLLETLCEDYIYEELSGSHRWWNDVFRVMQIKDKYIGYFWAETTGDNSIYDAGWEFNWDRLVEVEPIEKTVIVYKEKK